MIPLPRFSRIRRSPSAPMSEGTVASFAVLRPRTNLPSRNGSGISRGRWRRGREAEGGGLLNRYRVVKPYRGFESLRLRHFRSRHLRPDDLTRRVLRLTCVDRTPDGSDDSRDLVRADELASADFVVTPALAVIAPSVDRIRTDPAIARTPGADATGVSAQLVRPSDW
jgi:hypothetical protein